MHEALINPAVFIGLGPNGIIMTPIYGDNLSESNIR